LYVQKLSIQIPHQQTVGRILKCLAFITIFILILAEVSKLSTPKVNSTSVKMLNAPSQAFYAEPKDSVDIISLGNSNMVNGFSPMELWKKYGYAGYNCGVSAQIIFDSYTTLSDVLATQKPKLVILDADGIHPRAGHMDTFYSFTNAALQRLFPLIEYHDRWKNPQSFIKTSQSVAVNPVKGYALNGIIKPYQEGTKPNANNNTVASLDTFTTQQLDMLNNLCIKNGAKLLFVYIPTAFSWNQAKHKAIAQYASSHSIAFLDLNTNPKGFKFDWKTDTKDGGIHLNIWGAQAVTSYIGDYIKNNFSIPDHRGEAAYQDWNSEYSNYFKQVDSLKKKPK